ncbi:MAG: radical SAM protein [Nitrospirae bacterium]|nr:radical SAM protein [Nitrospirota bacterium]
MKKSILYIWLPCKKIYPLGISYLANAVHHALPEIRQHILDLSLIPIKDRYRAIEESVRSFHPDIISFSWRDIQVYAPHEGDRSLETAFRFYYSRNPVERLTAAFSGLRMIWGYQNQIREKLALIRRTARSFPGSQIAVGGGAFGVFPEQIIRRLPEGVMGVIGEGEEAVFSLLREENPLQHRTIYRKGDQIYQGTLTRSFPVEEMQMDFPYLESIYPQVPAYHGTFIGVQTKRGCPYLCSFCLYTYIEGEKVRYRSPEGVVREISELHRRWGVRNFWFADAQFIPGSHSVPSALEILDRIIHSRMNLTWSSYIRTSLINGELADRMVRSGVGDLEVSITSGSQEVLNEMKMGFRLDRLYEGCRQLKKAGYLGKIILNYSLNAPGETGETLMESVESYKKIVNILGDDQVEPMLFFLGVQPHTLFEENLIQEGYLSPDYDPLALNPFTIKKLLYNPDPLGPLVARACLEGWGKKGDKTGRDILLKLETFLHDTVPESDMPRAALSPQKL